MEKETINRTQQWLIEALLHLMEQKDYCDITVVDIAKKADLGRRTFYRYFKSKDEILLLYIRFILQDFAEFILKKEEKTPYTICISYFEFWNKHIELLKLLRKSNMLYFIGDRWPEFVAKVATMIGHAQPEQVQPAYKNYYYEFHFNFGGYWSVTIKWAEKENRETPEEMAAIITKLLSSTSP